LCGGEFVDHARDRALERASRRDVDDLATRRTEKVMMMVEEILGHLESGELVTGGDPSHDARLLEVREMAIGRTPRNLGDSRLNVRNAEGTLRRGQEFDHGSATGRVALIDSVQQHLDELV